MQNRNFVTEVYRKIKSQRLGNYVRRITKSNLDSAEDIQFYVNGEEINPKTEELIRSAKKEVLLQFYKFDDTSDAGEDIKLALVRLNEKCEFEEKIVRVKFLVNDQVGPAAWFTRSYPYPFVWLLKDGKRKYIEMDGNRYYLDHLNIETHLHPHYFFNCYHTKQIIIDRKKIMLRSGDVSKDTDYKEGQKLRTETATIINNKDIAQSAAESFLARWRSRGSKITRFKKSSSKNGEPLLLMEKNPSSNLFKKILYQSPFKTAMLHGINNATKCIAILTPNINDQAIVRALLAAVKRGVTVQLVTGKFHNQHEESMPGMGGTNQEIIKKMYDSLPLHLWEKLQVKWACDENGKLVRNKQPNAMHGKVAIFDDRIVIAGSSPLDKQATYFSAESDFVVEAEEVATQYIKKAFEPKFASGKWVIENLLEASKFSLIHDIENRISYSDLKFKARANSAEITKQKQACIETLVKNIGQANNLADIYKLLMDATQIVPNNPLAKERRIGLFSRKEFGRTHTIKELKTIIDLHFKDHLFVSEIDNQSKKNIVPAFF